MIIPLLDPGEGYRSLNVSAQRRLNYYIERTNDRSQLAMYGTPGLTLLTSFGTNIVRGARTIDQFTFIVAGSNVYALTAYPGQFVQFGTIATASGRVSMSDNGTQLIIVDGVKGYTYPLAGGSLLPITDPNFPNGATSVCFIGGFFVTNGPNPPGFVNPNAGRFHWSNAYDGNTWNALNFQTAETDPDNLLAVTQTRGELVLWGSKTIEIWALSNDTRVFARIGGSSIEWGLAAVNTIDRFGDDLIFLAKNRMGQYCVAVLSGYTVTPVSTPEIEYDLQQRAVGQLPSVSSATAYSYRYFGHNMYQVNFPDKSYLYDRTSNAWSEVGSGPAGTVPGRHYGEVRWELFSVPYVSDYRNGNVYSVDATNFTDNGDPIISRWTTRHVFEPNLGYVSVDEFQVDMETGVGIASGQGSNPQIMMRVSKDGGHTYGNERWLPGGAQGNFTNKAFALGLGVARDFTVELTISDPVKRAIANVQLRIR